MSLSSNSVNPSCRIPTTFAAFSAIRSRAALVEAQEPTQEAVDSFLDANQNLSAKRALTLFSMGMLMAFTGRWAFKSLFGKGKAAMAEPLKFETNTLLNGQPNTRYEQNIAEGYDSGLFAIVRLAFADPNQRKALLAYIGSSIVGYLSGSFMEGVQETWVRREETRIRSRLLSHMQPTFKKSIRQKTEADNALKKQAQKLIYDMLLRHNVPGAHELVGERPLVESFTQQRNYVYQPTHRTVAFGAENPNNTPASDFRRLAGSDKTYFHLMEGLVLGIGVVTGLTLQGFANLFTKKIEVPQYQGNKIVYETIMVRDWEAWLVNGLKSPKNRAILGLLIAMSAGAKLGKLFIDGLREIEVTRVHAQTELMYQRHNWLTLDPSFHRIAEEEALNNSLAQLEADLPHLRLNPQLLEQRIQTILTNIGRNSAPKYFQMTPPVGLMVARS